MTYRVWASSTDLGRRTAAAVDALEGLPRVHRADEPDVVAITGKRLPYTETACLLYEHPDGRTALLLTPDVARRAGAVVDVITDESGTVVRTTITATQTHAALPGERDEWAVLPPRGGLPRQREPEPRTAEPERDTPDAGGGGGRR